MGATISYGPSFVPAESGICVMQSSLPDQEAISAWNAAWRRRRTRSAHQSGILHRDIRPENIRVARNGYAKLADFGLAKLEEGAPGEAARTVTEGRARPTAAATEISRTSCRQSRKSLTSPQEDGTVLQMKLISQRREQARRVTMVLLSKSKKKTRLNSFYAIDSRTYRGDQVWCVGRIFES
jgi:serine/threonine protein kinase